MILSPPDFHCIGVGTKQYRSKRVTTDQGFKDGLSEKLQWGITITYLELELNTRHHQQ